MKKEKKLIIGVTLIIILTAFVCGYRYHIYQKTALQVQDMKSNNSHSIWLHGEESLRFQEIFLNEVSYLKRGQRDISKDEEKWKWSVVYYPRSFKQYALKRDFIKENDELLLNFDFYDEKTKERIVVFGTAKGGENRCGYITGDDYLYLKSILHKE